MHRAKAHLILNALRHRAAELGERGTFLHVETYGEGLDRLDQRVRDELEVVDPTSYAARRFVRKRGMHVLPSRGFVSSKEEFKTWADGRTGKRLLMEDFYRNVRERTGILMDGSQPAGGHWNYDHDNQQSPPKGAAGLGLPDPWWPVEDDIDAQVREHLDRWQAEGSVQLVGDDGPRFEVTAADVEAVTANLREGAQTVV